MARVVAPTGQLAAVRAVRPIQASRPAMLRSDFVGTSVSSMCSSIAGETRLNRESGAFAARHVQRG